MDKIFPDSLRHEFQSLYACREPLLVGIRHHSAAIARVLEELLEQYEPNSVLVEMPSDFADWFDLIADQETLAPIAISAVDSEGALAFYPLADFSPELVAIRWAIRHGVPLVACDLSVSARYRLSAFDAPSCPTTAVAPDPFTGASVGQSARLMELFLRRTDSRDTYQLWERLVESQAIVAPGEEVRRAALIFGWAVRTGTPHTSQRDLIREVAMREAIRSAPDHSAVIVGAYHAPALTPEVVEKLQLNDREILGKITSSSQNVGVSLVPYGFDQLDERSGYPAGIRDPMWHQMMLEAESAAVMEQQTIGLVVDLCRAIRKRQQVAGTPDATEIIRMMRGLGQMRRLPIPGRSELLEAVECCLTHGELNGRAREVAKALEQVLIGRRRGKVTPRTPRCGLAVAIEKDLKQLGLPLSTSTVSTTTQSGHELHLDVLRSARDRARGVVLRRLCLLGIPYGERVDSNTTGDRENLLERWNVSWQQGTAATIELIGHMGATLEQAVAGMLRLRFWQPQDSTGDLRDTVPSPQRICQYFAMAAECGMVEIIAQLKATFENDFCRIAGLAEIVQALILWGRIEAGHSTALPLNADDALAPYVQQFSCEPYQALTGLLLEAALQRLEGLAGSNEKQDSAAIADLAYWFETTDTGHFDRFVTWCWQTFEQGSEVMQGTAVGVLAMHRLTSSQHLAAFLSSSFDLASTSGGRQSLRSRLVGVVQVLLPQILADSSWLAGLNERFEVSSDAEFLQRLPALRGAFQEFSPADRQRLLFANLERMSERGIAQRTDDLQEITLLGIDPDLWLAHLRAADLHAQSVIEALLPGMLEGGDEHASNSDGAADSSQPGYRPASIIRRHDSVISIADRWRMVLGIPPEERTIAQRAATRLDDLYGSGSGEGTRDRLGNRLNRSSGGDEAPLPVLAEWSDELAELFGADVCQEVLGEAISGGNLAATQLLDADQVTPSVELLRQIMTLAGGLAEQRADHLRKLAKKITASLVEQLAIRLRPALNGLATPRPTRRRGRKLNLKRTLHDNLSHIYRRSDGNPRIVAKRLIFQSQSRREMDWHLTFVVDVSGSMSTSVVYSAICAAVFAELPALSVRFLAFSTEVIDLSDKVIDPLTLLLEVQVGGGTRIGLGLAAARAQIKVPQRSLLVLVSDFEEGVSIGEMLAEVRELVDSGVRCIGLAALDDTGVARFHQGCASMLAAAGMSVAAVAPEQLARWIGNQIRGSSYGISDQPMEGKL